jgi:signal transduction histidine kinase
MMMAATKSDLPLPPDAESRLANFTELVATAIANAESRAELARLAGEQAALRRVATLVAEESSPAAVFAQVAEEVAGLLGNVEGVLVRDEGDGTASTVAVWGDNAPALFPVGVRIPLPAESVVASALREGAPSRIDDYSTATGTINQGARALGIRSAVACPIVVAGRPWGGMAVATQAARAFPAQTERRIAQFSDLVATAIANAAARAEVQRLAEEQAALRRVATLVANGSPQGEVLAAVAEEMGRLLRGAATATWRYEPDGTATVVAVWDEAGTLVPIGTRVTPAPDSVSGIVLRTARPARTDGDADVTDPTASRVRDARPGCTVGAPIVVDGQLWGVMLAAAGEPESLPAGTETHMDEFTKLVATAISNVQARSELAASRARIVAAADEERRRVVGDLHDGAQQRLVHTVITLKLAHRALQNEGRNLPNLLAEALSNAELANVELRELAHGILPTALTFGGLRAGVDALALRMPVPVENDVSMDRFPAAVEATAYFVIAEALTNVAKHARASRAGVAARVEAGSLQVQVRDDGIGGARPDGSGLLGLADRLAALDGQLRVESPAAGGTLVTAVIPYPLGA